MTVERNFLNDSSSNIPPLSPWIPQLGPPLQQGKVREIYQMNRGEFVFLSTDRISAFDRVFTDVSGKGQVLTQLSAFWFTLLSKEHPEILHHYIANPDPNVLIVKQLEMLPIEFVVRGYLTGSTSTSIWKEYERGIRCFGGVELPDDLCKNSRLPCSILTPSTKSVTGDRNISEKEIVEEGILTATQWNQCKELSHTLFTWGENIAKERGLVLVDTKYEFGLDCNGIIHLADEFHTPDSSRYWLLKDVHEAFVENRNPQSFDKEWFRTWLSQSGNPYDVTYQPDIPQEIIQRIRDNYVHLYELIVQNHWQSAQTATPERIFKNLELFQSSRTR